MKYMVLKLFEAGQDYVSFTINIRPLGVALRSAYARGRPSR